MQHLQPNTTLQGGKYKITRLLGHGGFGNTYMGINTIFDDPVAIKEFFIQGINSRDEITGYVSVSLKSNVEQFVVLREKFRKEAIRIRKLNNQHIVKVHDLFEENGTAYYVMDYVDGENLSERLKRTGKPMKCEEVNGILYQILDALKTVHEAKIWHLDLKPANIMINKQGVIKLIDFGASKQYNSQKGGATTSSAISYTNGYAPREQMEQNYEKFGPWTDFYALGATIYTLLSKKRPPMPTDIDEDVSEDKRYSLPLSKEIAGSELHRLIMWLMSANRNSRPQRVQEIVTFLNQNDNKEKVKEANEYEDTVVIPQLEKSRKIEDKIAKEKRKIDNREKKQARGEEIVYNAILALKFAVITGAIGIIIGLCSVVGNRKDKFSFSDVIDKMPTLVRHVEEPERLRQDQEGVEVVAYIDSVFQMSYKSPIGESKYTGPVDHKNRPNGIGEAFFSDGRYYKGPFEAGNLTGENAFFKYQNGDIFKGSFKDNSFHEGIYTLAEDGSYFKGTYKNGQPDKGSWYDKNGKLLQ